MEFSLKHLADMASKPTPLLSVEVRQFWEEFVDTSQDPTVEDLSEFLREFDQAISRAPRYQDLDLRFKAEVRAAKAQKVSTPKYLFSTSQPTLEQVRQVYNHIYTDMGNLGETREALVDALKDFRSEYNKLKGLYDSLHQFTRDPRTTSDLKSQTERDRLFHLCTPQLLYLKQTLQGYLEDLSNFLESTISKIFHLSRIDSHVKVFLSHQDLASVGIQVGGPQTLWDSGAPGAQLNSPLQRLPGEITL